MNTPYTHPDWQHLLTAVASAPDDDLPRLVAADWLDEHGEAERAEFIRIQVERERADRPELKWREEALWNNPLCGPLWAVEACPGLVTLTDAADAGSPLRGLGVWGVERVTFRRGFPYRIDCRAADWATFGCGIVPRQPVREVFLTACDVVPFERWWDMLDTLTPLAVLTLDTRSITLAPLLRDHLNGVDVRVSGRPAPRLVLAAAPVATPPAEIPATQPNPGEPGVARTGLSSE